MILDLGMSLSIRKVKIDLSFSNGNEKNYNGDSTQQTRGVGPMLG